MVTNVQPLRHLHRGRRAVRDEQATRLPVLTGCQADPFQGIDKDRRGGLTRTAQIVARVAWSDERHVDALDRGDLLRGSDRPRGLDLHDADD